MRLEERQLKFARPIFTFMQGDLDKPVDSLFQCYHRYFESRLGAAAEVERSMQAYQEVGAAATALAHNGKSPISLSRFAFTICKESFGSTR